MPVRPSEHGGNENRTSLSISNLDGRQRTAVRLAASDGKVTTGVLSKEAGISKPTALAVLRGLVDTGVLVWRGKSSRDPYQHYVFSEGWVRDGRQL